MLSDYEKIEFLRTNKYFETNTIAEIIKYIKFQCMRYLVQDGNIGLDGYTFDDYLQPWIDEGFKDKDFHKFLKEQTKDDNSYIEYQNTYDRIAKFLNQKVGKPKDTKATYFFTKTSKIKFEHTAYRLIKQAIVDLTNINYEALEVELLDEYQLLLNNKKCKVHEKFQVFNLKSYLKKHEGSKELIGLYEFENYLNLPSIISDKILQDNTLIKTLFIHGIAGSGKTVLAQKIAYEISNENSFYLNLAEQEYINILQKNTNSINSFIENIKNAKGTIVLDNIGFSDISIILSKKILTKCNKVGLNIVLIAQYEIIIDAMVIRKFSDFYFFTEKYLKLKKNIYFLEFSSDKKLIENRFSMIKNLVSYYQKKDYRYQKISEKQVIKLENEFGGLLAYLKYAIDGSFSFNIGELTKNDAKLQIIKHYNEFMDMSYCKEFKFSITLINSSSGAFRIRKNAYKTNLVDELIFIEDLKKAKKLYFVNEWRDYKLFFSHKIIPSVLVQAIVKKENINLEKLILDTVKYLLNLNGRVLYQFIDAYINSEFFEVVHMIKIFDTLLKKISNRKKHILDSMLMENIFKRVSHHKDINLYIEYMEKNTPLLSEKLIFD